MTGAGRPLPRLHVVTDDDTLARAGWTQSAVAVLQAGGAEIALHVRGPASSGRAILEHVTRLAPVARATGSTLIVNDRVDVALVSACHGVHLGRRSIPVADARVLLGPGRLLGCSAGDAAGVIRAGESGADYAFVGTIFPTPSHRGVPGIGPIGLREAVQHGHELPVLGIGGIHGRRTGAVLATGAWGVAVMSGVWDRPDPAAAARALLQRLRGDES